MDAERFAKGFERDPRDYARLSGKAWRQARDQLIDPPLRWSHFFSHVVDSYLTGDELDYNDVYRNISMYTGDSTRHLLSNVIATTERAAVYRPSLTPYLNQMNFHTINQEMGPAWLHLIDPETYSTLNRVRISAIQARLATKSLHLVEVRRGFYDELLATTPHPSEEQLKPDRSLVGRITEVDAAITLLEMVKQQPASEAEHLVVLPAPSKYEGFPNKASDFLLFDTYEWQAHGVQVKTRVHDPTEYDESFVSFIDGVEDLGNSKEKIHPSGAVGTQPIPGLIAADFILHSQDIGRFSSFSRLPEFKGMFGSIYHAREVAETMKPHLDYPDRAARAARKIGPRLLAALHVNEPEDIKEPGQLPGSDELL